MISFKNVLISELIKLKRTPVIWVVFLIPLLILYIFSIFFSIRAGSLVTVNMQWLNLFYYIQSTLGIFILPAFIILETAMLCNLEHQNKSLRYIYTLPAQRWKIFTAKLAAVHGLIIVSLIIFFLYTIFAGTCMKLIAPELNFTFPPPVITGLKKFLLLYPAAWTIISIHLWIGMRFGNPGIVFITGAVLLIAAAVLFRGDNIIYNPWSLIHYEKGLAYNQEFLIKEVMYPSGYFFKIAGGMVIAILACFDLQRQNVYS